MESAFNIKSSSMTVIGEASGTEEFEFRKDYFITTPSNISGTYELKYITMKDLSLYYYEEHSFNHLHDMVLLADVRGLDGLAQDHKRSRLYSWF
ncbi:MAG: hypothetical protein ACYCYE_07970 [Clostridia bacterium]